MIEPVAFRFHEGDRAAILAVAEWFRAQLFPALPADFLRARLPFVADPQLCLAEHSGRPVGFKLAYRLTGTLLFSWLGGVLPEHRRSGIADGLMRFQHDAARDAGFIAIETRTRTDNNAMLILNLRHGFRIVGLETDVLGRFVAIQRKPLLRSAAAASVPDE